MISFVLVHANFSKQNCNITTNVQFRSSDRECTESIIEAPTRWDQVSTASGEVDFGVTCWNSFLGPLPRGYVLASPRNQQMDWNEETHKCCVHLHMYAQCAKEGIQHELEWSKRHHYEREANTRWYLCDLRFAVIVLDSGVVVQTNGQVSYCANKPSTFSNLMRRFLGSCYLVIYLPRNSSVFSEYFRCLLQRLNFSPLKKAMITTEIYAGNKCVSWKVNHLLNPNFFFIVFLRTGGGVGVVSLHCLWLRRKLLPHSHVFCKGRAPIRGC